MLTLLFRVEHRVGRARGTLYGCPITDLLEIVPLRPVTRLPGAPAYVRGLINMRGTIVTVLDLRLRLDPTRTPIDFGSILVVRHRAAGIGAVGSGRSDRLVGVLVAGVLDVRPLVVEHDDTVRSDGGIIRGLAMLDAAARDATVVVLDLESLIAQALIA